jgi:hypothetical protein
LTGPHAYPDFLTNVRSIKRKVTHLLVMLIVIIHILRVAILFEKRSKGYHHPPPVYTLYCGCRLAIVSLNLDCLLIMLRHNLILR